MAILPSELWIMIFDLVIIEGIARLDQCDYTTFPYDHVFLSCREDRRFSCSYHRLRLVCRRFNALLGIQPDYDLDPSSFPFPTSVRALRLGGLCDEPVFQQLLGDTARCERLVFLEASCNLTEGSTGPHLPDLLKAGEAGSFPNVQRLTLLFTIHHAQRETSFWTRLNRGFAKLVTLSVEVSPGLLTLDGKKDKKAATFERLEILYLGGTIFCSGCCHFPRLRHTSIEKVSGDSTLQIFRGSPHLECLLIRFCSARISIDVTPFSRLRVLSLYEHQLYDVVPLDCDHPLEHLWLYLADLSKNPTLVEEIVKRIPRIFRISMDFSFVNWKRRTQRIHEFQKMKLDSFGLAVMSGELNGRLLVIE